MKFLLFLISFSLSSPTYVIDVNAFGRFSSSAFACNRELFKRKKEKQNVKCSLPVPWCVIGTRYSERFYSFPFSSFIVEIFKGWSEENIGLCFCCRHIKIAESELEASILSFQKDTSEKGYAKKNQLQKRQMRKKYLFSLMKVCFWRKKWTFIAIFFLKKGFFVYRNVRSEPYVN